MSVALLVANWLAVALLCVARTSRRPFNLLDPAWAFLAGYFINYCLRPALFLYDPLLGGAYSDWIYPEQMIRSGVSGALVFALIGLAGFAIGDCYFERLAARISVHLPTTDLKTFAKRGSYSGAAFLFLVIGWVGLFGFISVVGWSGTLIAFLTGELRNVFNEDILGHGYYTFAMQLSLVGWVLICLKWIGFPKKRHGFRRFSHTLVCLGWFLAMLLLWIAVGERSSIITVLFIPFALWLALGNANDTARRRETHMRKTAAILVLFAILFIAIAGPLGLYFKGMEVAPAAVVSMAVSAWDSFEFTMMAQDKIRARDLAWGRTYVGDLLYTWLPRSLFPNKPERYGVVVIQDKLLPELAENVGATFPPGILVEAFANFGYMGLFLIPFAIGLFCHVVYLRLEAGNLFWVVQSVLFFPVLASFRSLGGVLAIFLANVAVLAAVLIVLRVIRVLSGPAVGVPTHAAPLTTEQ